jgi:repressor LexA
MRSTLGMGCDSSGRQSVPGPHTKGVELKNNDPALSPKRRQILEFIDKQMRDNGFPPSVREIGEAVGLTSSSTVHSHLETLQRQGFLRRHTAKPRAMEVCWDSGTDTILERRPTRHVPLVGNVAAGTDVLAQENLEEMLPLPEDFTGGEGQLFMLKVRGESMIDAGIFDGDFVVVRQQPTASNGDIVVAGIPGEEATVKTYRTEGRKIVLIPHNPTMERMVFPASEVNLYGKVVTVLRKL